MAVCGVVLCTVAVSVDGWSAALYLGPAVLVAAAGYYLWAGRDSDMAAMLRRQDDERQAYRRLRIQALVGRVMGGATSVAYLVAFAAKATLWPFALFLALQAAALLAGWVIYRERDGAAGNSLTGKSRVAR
jgi:hypothetical protein